MRNETDGDRGPRVPAPQATAAEPERPIKPFLAVSLGIAIPLLWIPVLAGIPLAPFLLALVFLALLAPALVMTRRFEGRQAMRHLLSRIFIWRFSPVRWAVILLGVPLLTIAIAAASGTLFTPEGGWSAEVTTYLLGTLVIGALFLNLWEETAWGGFFQTRIMAKRGLVAAAVLTALPFAIVHIPLSFEGDWTWSEAAIALATLFLAAPFYRYLLGMHLLDTGGSILAIGIQHASWNQAMKIDGVHGDWQAVLAVGVLTLLVAVGRRMWPGSHPLGLEQEKAAAASWLIAGNPERSSRSKEGS